MALQWLSLYYGGFIDTMSMRRSIVYFKTSQVEFSNVWCISVPEDCLNHTKHCI